MKPHHTTLHVEQVRNNLCDPNELNWRIRLTGLPIGLTSVFTVGSVEPGWSRHSLKWEEGLVADISEIHNLVQEADEYIRTRYLYNSAAREIRELRLWFDINYEQLEEQWYRWRSWDLRRQIGELELELEKHDATTQFIESELAERVAAAAEEARLAQI